MDTLFLFIVLAVACVFYILANYDSDESYLDDVVKDIKQVEEDDYEWRE